MQNLSDTQEERRLQEARELQIPWMKWGPYLSERQWGTVREDYRDNGDAWDYFTHDQARSFSRGLRAATSGGNPKAMRAGCRPPPASERR